PLPVLLLDAHFLGLLLALRLLFRADSEEAARVSRALLVGADVELAACLLPLDHHGGGGRRALARAVSLVVIGRVEHAGLYLLAVIRIHVRHPDSLFPGFLGLLDPKLDQGADFAAKTLAVGADIGPLDGVRKQQRIAAGA